jgi:hypothetical protein
MLSGLAGVSHGTGGAAAAQADGGHGPSGPVPESGPLAAVDGVHTAGLGRPADLGVPLTSDLLELTRIHDVLLLASF